MMSSSQGMLASPQFDVRSGTIVPQDKHVPTLQHCMTLVLVSNLFTTGRVV